MCVHVSVHACVFVPRWPSHAVWYSCRCVRLGAIHALAPQRGVGQKRDIPRSVRAIAGTKEKDNGLLYQPGAVLPEALLPRPKTPPTMVPVYASGPSHRCVCECVHACARSKHVDLCT